jgi:hypothetical protein
MRRNSMTNPTLPSAIRMTLTAWPIMSAGRFSPLEPRGKASILRLLPRLHRIKNSIIGKTALINEFLQRFLSSAFFPVLSFQLDLPLPMSRTGHGILPMEEVHVREQFPRYIDSVLGTGVLLQLEDCLRHTTCTPCDTVSS